MAGVVKGMDVTLKSMNLEKVDRHLMILFLTFSIDKTITAFISALFPLSPDFSADGQIRAPV